MIVEQGIQLITLVGPGGSGKTRLALQAGEDLSEQFGSRVFFVSLASLTEPELVGPEIALALDIHAVPSPVEAIQRELAAEAEPTLLILDNFEHVTGAAPIVGDLLARVYDGSASAMVLNLIETADLDGDELAELRRLIARKAKEQQK